MKHFTKREPDYGEAWHAMPVEAVLARLAVTLHGLNQQEAARRLYLYGPNALPEMASAGPLLVFFRQFASPLIYLLLAAGLLSLFIGNHWDAAFIFGVLLLNAIMGAGQELKADACARALRSLVSQVAIVRRDGTTREINAVDIVPGDIVELESGMRIAADLRLLESQGLHTDEALLTGESLPVAKDARACPDATAPVADRTTIAHAGTTVSSGRAVGVVLTTGQGTEIGRIGRSMNEAERSGAVAPLVARMAMLARQIAMAAVSLILLLAALLALQGQAWRDIPMLGIGRAVSAIREGLPIAVTVALAAAARRMAGKNVIVRSLPAVEGLGACTLIASDKTGTLTLNRLTVGKVILPDGTPLDRSDWLDSSPSRRVAALAGTAALCNEADLSVAGMPVGDAVDVALLWFAQETGNALEPLLAVQRLAIIPYEPAQRFAAAEVEIDGSPRVVVKGAPETILAMCTDAGPEIVEGAEQLASEGYRVLALAEGLESDGKQAIAAKLQNMRFAGLLGLSDPLRAEVPEAVRKCLRAGIDVRMITGDHPATALAIARQLGFAEGLAEVVTGGELAAFGEDEAARTARVVAAKVFARIDPAQKLAIVRILQSAGEIVAATGDGVNDGPALEAAHIGVAMGRGGTDVGRGAADPVLVDDNFASIVAGVEEGRITLSNIRKIVTFVLATGLAEIGMFLAALLAGLPMPLTPVQLLWLNLVTNGVQDVTLGFGTGDGDEMGQRPHRKLAALVDRDGLFLMLPAAAVMTLGALWLLHREISIGASPEEARNSVLLMVVLFQNSFLISIRHLRLPLWRVHSENHWLFLGMAAALAIHICAMHFAPLQGLLEVSPVSYDVLIYCLIGSLAVLLVTELSRRARQRWVADPPCTGLTSVA